MVVEEEKQVKEEKEMEKEEKEEEVVEEEEDKKKRRRRKRTRLGKCSRSLRNFYFKLTKAGILLWVIHSCLSTTLVSFDPVSPPSRSFVFFWIWKQTLASPASWSLTSCS